MRPDLVSFLILRVLKLIIQVLRALSPHLILIMLQVLQIAPASKLFRYEAAIERSLYRALHELQRVQAARENGQAPASIAVDVTVDDPGSPSDNED